jgi:hypothetical protein
VSRFGQIANIKFIQKLGKSAAEILLTLQFVYGIVLKIAVYDWYSCLRSERELLEE